MPVKEVDVSVESEALNQFEVSADVRELKKTLKVSINAL